MGRDSTALNELIKNAYDADATEVIVHGEALDERDRAAIVVTDNGHGMSIDVLESGFLTIATRFKESGDRRSPIFGRRMTGAKGVGRLAAQKLARLVTVDTTPDPRVAAYGANAVGGSLRINWARIEELATIDKVEGDGAVTLTEAPATTGPAGTRLGLEDFRRPWSDKERSAVMRDLQSFRPAPDLLNVAETVVARETLLGPVSPADTSAHDPGFSVLYVGELDVGESFYDRLLVDAEWMIEIDAAGPTVRYQITPTVGTERRLKHYARIWKGEMAHPAGGDGPLFNARLFVRRGAERGEKQAREWSKHQRGVRVFLEGFRVLPYADIGDDWLSLDSDYRRRTTGDLPYVREFAKGVRSSSSTNLRDGDSGLFILGSGSYTGGVFLKESSLGGLRMVVNREGFVADEAWRTVQAIVRVGIDISVRHRAACTPPEDSRRTRPGPPAAGQPTAPTPPDSSDGPPHSGETRPVGAPADNNDVAGPVTTGDEPRTEPVHDDEGHRLLEAVRAARVALAGGDLPAALTRLSEVQDITDPPIGDANPETEQEHLAFVLQSLGLQLHAFIHEINAALGMVATLSKHVAALRAAASSQGSAVTSQLARVEAQVAELRQHLERQATSLIDVTGPDARRRRARLSYSERFDVARALHEQVARRRGVSISNHLPPDLRSLPMFPAELTMLFTNLLSNAIKAAGSGGRVDVTGTAGLSGMSEVRIENTGVRVDLAEGERWFRPFESTTVRPDPVLGQGMGLGLPISRRIVESYGGTLRFDAPSQGYSTAIVLRLPEK